MRHGYQGYVCGLSSVLNCIGKGPRRVVPVASGVAVSARFSGCGSDNDRSWGSVVELEDKDKGLATLIMRGNAPKDHETDIGRFWGCSRS